MCDIDYRDLDYAEERGYERGLAEIQKARDEEAEACAKIAEDAGAGFGHTVAQGIADRIRARIRERAFNIAKETRS